MSPQQAKTKPLGQQGVTWLESRGISAETASRFGIYTARQDRNRAIPDERGNVLAFPFFEHGVVVAEKYRRLPKGFFQRPGGKRTFWNADVLDDPSLYDGRAALVITEGEVDALTSIDCGFPFAVSVPDGAPTLPFGEHPEKPSDRTVDLARSREGKFEFIWNNRERLKKIKRFIIAVDADEPGQWLAAELVRLLLPSKCLFVRYQDGLNDLNAVRMQHGPEGVAAVLNSAQPYPVHGLFRLSEFPELPSIRTYSTGWPELDRYLRPFPGELMFVLGLPSHGKSALMAHMLVNFAEQYGWCSVVFSPEEPTVPLLRDKLRRIRLRSRSYETDIEKARAADRWVNEHFLFIASDPRSEDDNELYLEWIVARATDAVLRDGVRVLLIDPWNEVEQARERGESQTEYIGRAIRMLNRFRHQHDVVVIVLIHPTKEVGREGKVRAPTPYDAEGSAHFFNKADHFLIVHRPDKSNNESIVRVAKVKFEGTGREGVATMKFDTFSGRFRADGEEAASNDQQLEAFK